MELPTANSGEVDDEKNEEESPNTKRRTLKESMFSKSAKGVFFRQENQETLNLSTRFKEIAENGMEVYDDHRLISKTRHESEVEQLVYRIEERRTSRISITADVGKRFIKLCRRIAKRKSYSANLNKIRVTDLLEIKKEVKEESNFTKFWSKFFNLLGIRTQRQQLLICIEKAEEVINRHENNGESENWFYFEDFNVYYTRIESRWPWIRNRFIFSLLSLLFLYGLTPVLFCVILKDKDVCPQNDFSKTFYFVSATLSTVGYGDVTINKDNDWRLLCGVFYILLCNICVYVTFSGLVDDSNPFLDNFGKSMLKYVWGNNQSERIQKKILRLIFLRVSQIFFNFFIINLIGVVVSLVYTDWGLVKSIYWSVQTTTTVGYGDLNMGVSDSFRAFLTIYLIIATWVVGNALGGLASLRQEINDMKAKEAWNRREASNGLIDELQPYHRDDKIDQYEFMLASLVILGKITYGDVVPVMDKFRSLARDEGFIMVEEVENQYNDIEQKLENHNGDQDARDDSKTTTFDESILVSRSSENYSEINSTKSRHSSLYIGSF